MSHATAFTSFAVPTILGEIRRYFRDKTWSVRMPRGLKELAATVNRATEQLALELGRSPTPAETAARAGCSVEDVLEAREVTAAYRSVSLDAPRADGEEASSLGASFGVEEAGYGRAEASATLETLMEVLTPRQREVLRLRFEEDLTQSEIGARVGVSQMHVSRLIRQSIALLRVAAHEPA